MGELSTSAYAQGRIIRDLLEHAAGDGMSAEDRTICQRALDLLALDAAKQSRRPA